MSLLPKPLSGLLSTAISALAGWITVLIAEHAPFVHVTHDQVVAGILFALGALLHAAHAHGWDRFIVGRVTKLEGLAQPIVRQAGLSAVEKELATLAGKLEALIRLHAPAGTTGNANPAPSVTVTTSGSASKPTKPVVTKK